MSFTHKSAARAVHTVLPGWVEDIRDKYPAADYKWLAGATIAENHSQIIITTPGMIHAQKAKEECGHALQAFWPSMQIIFRFRDWNKPRCLLQQYETLKRLDPALTEPKCDRCEPGYGCNRAVS